MKKWTLEDDSDEEEDKQDNKENKEGEEEEVDPLDAFMMGVQEEVRKVNKLDGKKADGKPGSAVNTNSSGVVIVTGVAKKKVDKKKGELIEQNQDGLEVCRSDILLSFVLK